MLILRRCGPLRDEDLAIRQLAAAKQNKELDLYRRLLARFARDLRESEDDLHQRVERHIELASERVHAKKASAPPLFAGTREMSRGADSHPASLSAALRNDRCGYCGRTMTKRGDYRRTKEHVVPKSVTGSRPYDFMACLPCGNEKSKLDEQIAWQERFGCINAKQLGPFDLTSVSYECRKSVKAFLRRLDFTKQEAIRHEDEEWVAIPVSEETIQDLKEWTRWFARGIYFLETGVALKCGKGLRYTAQRSAQQFGHVDDLDMMIDVQLLDGKAMIALTQEGCDKGVTERIFRPATDAPRWGNVWLEWQSIKAPSPACLCLGGKYVFSATVKPYSEEDC